MAEKVHCGNYDEGYPGCRECPGKVDVTHPDGTVDTICRAGQKAIREMMEIPTIGQILPEVFERLRVRNGQGNV